MRFSFRPLRVHTFPFPPYRGGFSIFIKYLQYFEGLKRLSPQSNKQQYLSKLIFQKDFVIKRQKRRHKDIQRRILVSLPKGSSSKATIE
jgi:hypothetical protein